MSGLTPADWDSLILRMEVDKSDMLVDKFRT